MMIVSVEVIYCQRKSERPVRVLSEDDLAHVGTFYLPSRRSVSFSGPILEANFIL